MRQTPVCSVWATLTTSVIVPRQFYLSAFLMRTSKSVLKDIRWNINPHPGCKVCKRKHLGGLLGPLHLPGWLLDQSSLIVENEPTIRQAHLWIYDNQNHQIHNHHQNQQRQYPAASKPSSHLQRRALLDPWLSGKLLGCICTNNSLSIWFWWWWKLKTRVEQQDIYPLGIPIRISSCQGAPAYGSAPHFLSGAPELSNATKGLHFHQE